MDPMGNAGVAAKGGLREAGGSEEGEVSGPLECVLEDEGIWVHGNNCSAFRMIFISGPNHLVSDKETNKNKKNEIKMFQF